MIDEFKDEQDDIENEIKEVMGKVYAE